MCSDDEWKLDEEKQEPANPEVSGVVYATQAYFGHGSLLT